MNAAYEIALEHIDFRDLFNYLIAILSAKIRVPQYRIASLKRKFLTRCVTLYGYFHSYPNTYVEGPYQYEDSEGIIVGNRCPPDSEVISCTDITAGKTRQTSRNVCGVAHGKFISKSFDITVIISYFDGNKHGLCMNIYADGSTIKQLADNGYPTGLRYRYAADGTLINTCKLNRNWDMNGEKIRYDKQGNIINIKFYADGIPLWKKFTDHKNPNDVPDIVYYRDPSSCEYEKLTYDSERDDYYDKDGAIKFCRYSTRKYKPTEDIILLDLDLALPADDII
jgi:hypothetical protein